MAKRISALLLLILFCAVMGTSVFATNAEPLKNIEFVQLNFLENGNGVLGVYYGYPIHDNATPIEKTELYTGDVNLFTSELTVSEKRYAVICCSVEYSDTTDLLSKINEIPNIKETGCETVLFNFYVLLDSIAKNLNFAAIEQGTVSLTIDTSSFVNQKYYMIQVDDTILSALPDVDIKTMRDVDTRFYLIVANNIEVSNSEQFVTRELTDVYTEYSCSLNNQKLSLILSQKQPVVEEPVEMTKLDQFLNSKYYTWFIVGSCTFIVLAIIAMIIVAKSFNKVMEKEEKRIFEEKLLREKEEKQLYWTKEEREAEKKKKDLMKNPNALVRDGEYTDRTDSIENVQYKRQSSFTNK